MLKSQITLCGSRSISVYYSHDTMNWAYSRIYSQKRSGSTSAVSTKQRLLQVPYYVANPCFYPPGRITERCDETTTFNTNRDSVSNDLRYKRVLAVVGASALDENSYYATKMKQYYGIDVHGNNYAYTYRNKSNYQLKEVTNHILTYNYDIKEAIEQQMLLNRYTHQQNSHARQRLGEQEKYLTEKLNEVRKHRKKYTAHKVFSNAAYYILIAVYDREKSYDHDAQFQPETGLQSSFLNTALPRQGMCAESTISSLVSETELKPLNDIHQLCGNEVANSDIRSAQQPVYGYEYVVQAYVRPKKPVRPKKTAYMITDVGYVLKDAFGIQEI